MSEGFPSKLVHTLQHDGPVHALTYNHGARYVLSGGADRTIRLWNPASGKEVKVYRGHAHEVLCVDVAHDNTRFASCGGDRAVFLWDVASGAVTRRLQGHFGKVFCVAWSADGGVLASAGFDAKVLLWDTRSGTRDPLQTLKGATSSITALVVRDAEILTGSSDGEVRVWDVRMGRMTADCVGEPICGLTPSAKGDTLLVSTDKVRLFDRSDGKVLQTFTGAKVRTRAAFDRAESSVCAGDDGGRLWTWNVLDGTGASREVHARGVTGVIVHPAGKEMVTASLDGCVKVWGR